MTSSIFSCKHVSKVSQNQKALNLGMILILKDSSPCAGSDYHILNSWHEILAFPQKYKLKNTKILLKKKNLTLGG